MKVVFTTITITNGNEQQIKADLKPLIETILKNEPNCFRFDMYVDSKNPLILYSTELFADQSTLDAHMNTPYLKAFLEKHGNSLRLNVQEYDAEAL